MRQERFMCHVGVHLLLFQGSKILMLKRKNTGYGDGMWSVPAGCIDGNECVTDAVIREAKEETGIDISREKLSFSSVMHGIDDRESVAFFFKTDTFEGKITNSEPHKCEELKFFSVDRLPAETIPYVKQGIECAFGKLFFSEYGWEKDLVSNPS